MGEKTPNKIAKLETEYAKEQYVEFQKQHRQLIFRRRRLALVFCVAAIIFAVVGFHLFNDYRNLQGLQVLEEQAVTEQKEAKGEVDKLQRDVSLLEDENYVAKLARSKFYYSKDGELIFRLPEKSETTTSTENSNTTAK